MKFSPSLIFALGWIFFAAWGLVLATASWIAFRQDLIPLIEGSNSQPERR